MVIYCAEQVYPMNLTEGVAAQPTTSHAYHPPSSALVGTTMETPKGKGGSCKKVAMRCNNRSSSLGSVEDGAGATSTKIQAT
jgi:hypothetical protein